MPTGPTKGVPRASCPCWVMARTCRDAFDRDGQGTRTETKHITSQDIPLDVGTGCSGRRNAHSREGRRRNRTKTAMSLLSALDNFLMQKVVFNWDLMIVSPVLRAFPSARKVTSARN